MRKVHIGFQRGSNPILVTIKSGISIVKLGPLWSKGTVSLSVDRLTCKSLDLSPRKSSKLTRSRKAGKNRNTG